MSLQTHGSHSKGGGSGPDMGFPVTATITAASTIASTVLPSVLGGGPSPSEQRRRAIQAQRASQAFKKQVESDLKQMERQAKKWTRERAKEVLQSGAERIREEYLTQYLSLAQRSDIPGGQELAQQASTTIQQKALTEADNRLAWITLKENSGALIGAGAGVIGAGMIGYSYVSKNSSETKDG